MVPGSSTSVPLPSTPIPPGAVVVGLDGSPPAERALGWAAAQAVLERRALVLVHALAPLAGLTSAWIDQAGVDAVALREADRVEARALLLAAQLRLHERHPDLDVVAVLRDGDPRAALADVARDASLLVLGSRGRGRLASLLLGSVSDALARHASLPTVVVRDGGSAVADPLGRPGGVLVGVEGSPTGWDVLETAFRLASQRGWRLIALHSCRDLAHAGAPLTPAEEEAHSDAEALLGEALAGFGEKFPDVVVERLVDHGRADEALVRASLGRDLTVVGAERRGAVGTALFGSTAGAVLEHAWSSVVVVPTARHR